MSEQEHRLTAAGLRPKDNRVAEAKDAAFQWAAGTAPGMGHIGSVDAAVTLWKALDATEKALIAEQEKVVWGFHEEEHPLYAQGSKGWHELADAVTADEVTGLVNTIKAKDAEIAELKTQLRLVSALKDMT